MSEGFPWVIIIILLDYLQIRKRTSKYNIFNTQISSVKYATIGRFYHYWNKNKRKRLYKKKSYIQSFLESWKKHIKMLFFPNKLESSLQSFSQKKRYFTVKDVPTKLNLNLALQ